MGMGTVASSGARSTWRRTWAERECERHLNNLRRRREAPPHTAALREVPDSAVPEPHRRRRTKMRKRSVRSASHLSFTARANVGDAPTLMAVDVRRRAAVLQRVAAVGRARRRHCAATQRHRKNWSTLAARPAELLQVRGAAGAADRAARLAVADRSQFGRDQLPARPERHRVRRTVRHPGLDQPELGCKRRRQSTEIRVHNNVADPGTPVTENKLRSRPTARTSTSSRTSLRPQL